MRKTILWLHWCIHTACPPGRFGFECRDECGNCYQRHACTHVNGFCADGCNEGFKGQLCKTRRSTMFQSIVYVGILLYILLNYRVILLLILIYFIIFSACIDGEFGKDCTHNCSGNCLHMAVCDKYKGTCKSCSSGYEGPKCDRSKPVGSLSH